MQTQGVYGQIHPVGVGERPLFGGNFGDDNTINSNSETTSETFSPPSPSPSQQEQTEGDNTTRSEGNRAPTQKTQDQIWYEQHEGQAMKCLAQNVFKEYEEATGQSTEESNETIERCNHDMLYILGVCEQSNDEYSFCKSVRTYIDDHNIEQINERPIQLSQETIDSINEFDWNEDGVTDGSDFVSKPSTQ